MDADNGGRIDDSGQANEGGLAGNKGQDYSRRQVLSTAGLAAVAVPLVASAKSGAARRAASLVRHPGKSGAPQPGQVHVQYGADAASQA
ncbi:MAG: hypothetical protein ACTHJW_21260, partial [Streptosporangiaceae bacterium]